MSTTEATDKATARAAFRQTPDIDGTEFRGFARSVAQVSMLLILLTAAYLFFGRLTEQPRDIYVALVVGFATVVLALRSLSLLRKRVRVLLTLESLLMVAFITAVAMLTGGTDSSLINLYLLPLIVAAVVLGRRITLLTLLLVFLCHAAMAFWSSGASVPDAIDVLELAFRFAPVVLVTLLTSLLSENIRSTRARIMLLSERDDLTELYNMRAFTRQLDAVHLAAVRHDQNYAIVMLDVDNLKPINDAHGHEAGNRAIRLVGNAITRCIRSSDVAARYGGDEFIVLLPHSDLIASEQAVRRIRNSVFATTLKTGKKMVRISVSIGLATFPADGSDPGALLAHADRKMYEDKAHRRDRARTTEYSGGDA